MSLNEIGSSEAQSSWKQTLSELQNELKDKHPLDESIPNEKEFRDKFVALDKALHDVDPDQNYAYFIRYHEPILFFIHEIDSAVRLKSPDSLSDLFWTVAYIAVQASLRKHRSKGFTLTVD